MNITAGFFGIMVFTTAASICLAQGEKPARPASEKKPKNNQERIDAVRLKLDSAKALLEVFNKKRDCDGDGDCEVLEIGNRSCGGPSSYLIVASRGPNISIIKAKIVEIDAAEKELNTIDMTFDCTPAPVFPQARCIKNLCAEGK